jgi:protein-tyrosine-phosphatase
MFYSNITFAEKVECELLSPMQKAIYKAYCQAEAKKKIASSSGTSSSSTVSNIKEKTGGIFKKLKINTDSTLFKTGKYNEKK